jgi:hypothetical protein
MSLNKSPISIKKNKATIILFLAIAWIFMQVLISVKPFGLEQIHSISPDTKILELQFNYSQDAAHKTLEQLGDAGRKAYSTLIIIDFIYITVYVSFFSFCIRALVSFFKFDRNFVANIWILPVCGGILDIVENIVNLIQIAAFPVETWSVYSLSNWITMCKYVVGLACYAILLLGFIVYLICLIRNKILSKRIATSELM